MKEAVIAGYLRSLFFRSYPGDPERADRDLFNRIRMDELAARMVNELLGRLNIEKKDVDEFLSDCALGVGEN